jgi:hypothetical protein
MMEGGLNLLVAGERHVLANFFEASFCGRASALLSSLFSPFLLLVLPPFI